jgi:type VI secretion system protein ImpJ
MQNPQVRWSEGMFLRPHHFQASDRYWSELAEVQYRFDHPYGYGLYRASLSAEGLRNGSVEVVGIQARTRQGTLITNDANQRDVIDLKVRLKPDQTGQPITVFLAVPRFNEGAKNVGAQASDSARYLQVTRELAEECEGGNRQDVGLRQLNYRLLLSIDELAGYDAVPIARLLPSATELGSFRLDPDYFPPSLTISAWTDLISQIRDLNNFIGGRLKTVSALVRDQGLSLSSQTQGDQERLWLLNILNQSYADLSFLVSAPGIHPVVAYQSLCSILGRASLFGPNLSIEETMAYDHDNLGKIFIWICQRIRDLINSVKEDEVIQRYFIGSGPGMHVQLEAEWLDSGWEWFFGVSPINFTAAECFQLFSSKKIDVKIGSSEKVEQYMTNRQPGLHLQPVQRLPRQLANRGKWVYFQMSTEGDPWRQVQLAQKLGLRIQRDQISNRDTLEGQKRLHLTVDGKTYGVEFAVFAIKQRRTS